jgi:hypothetical protein
MQTPQWDKEMMALASLDQQFKGFSEQSQGEAGPGPSTMHYLNSTQTPGDAGPGPSTMQYLNSMQTPGDAGPGPSTLQYLNSTPSDFGRPSSDQPQATSHQTDESKSFDASVESGRSITAEPHPLAAEESAEATDQHNGHSAILDAIGNQVGYLEGQSGEPFLRVYYYRVVSVAGSDNCVGRSAVDAFVVS